MLLRQLEYLQLVVSKGSFGAAAKAAGVSQPAITLAMQRLEQEWGIALFEKVGRQKLPTRAALVAVQRAADLHGKLRVLARLPHEALRWAPSPTTAVLKVGMAPAAALLYGPLIELEWRKREPQGLLQIIEGSSTELLAALQGHELDLAIAPRPRRFQARDIKRTPLHMSTPIVYGRRGHPLGSATSLNEIKDAGWAVAGRAGTAGNVIEEAHRVRRLPAPRILVQCADYATLLNLIALTDLLCVIPHSSLSQHSEDTPIAALSIREGLPQYEVCLFWLGKQPGDSSVVTDLVQELKELVRRSEDRVQN